MSRSLRFVSSMPLPGRARRGQRRGSSAPRLLSLLVLSALPFATSGPEERRPHDRQLMSDMRPPPVPRRASSVQAPVRTGTSGPALPAGVPSPTSGPLGAAPPSGNRCSTFSIASLSIPESSSIFATTFRNAAPNRSWIAAASAAVNCRVDAAVLELEAFHAGDVDLGDLFAALLRHLELGLDLRAVARGGHGRGRSGR
jgi:hypothetical protein